jgi:hypothetical protein
VIPIPGSSNAKRVKQNTESADIKLSEDDLKEINRILQSFEIKGGRYPDHSSGLLVSPLILCRSLLINADAVATNMSNGSARRTKIALICKQPCQQHQSQHASRLMIPAKSLVFPILSLV